MYLDRVGVCLLLLLKVDSAYVVVSFCEFVLPIRCLCMFDFGLCTVIRLVGVLGILLVLFYAYNGFMVFALFCSLLFGVVCLHCLWR